MPRASKQPKRVPKRSSRRRRNTSQISTARPMRNLINNYRAINVYRFSRETMPQTVSFDIIPDGGAGFPAIGYLNFDNLQFNQLVQSVADFGKLFARYKVDKIVTILTPMYQDVPNDAARALNSSPQLTITRINTKWLTAPFTIQPNSNLQLQELAQIQSKSVSNYATRKSLVLTTVNPGVLHKAVVDSTGNEIDYRGQCPWLNITDDPDIPLRHNSLIFAQRTDGQALTTDWKYRVVHKVYFRCSQVG